MTYMIWHGHFMTEFLLLFQFTYFIGTVFVIGGCLWFYFMPKNNLMIYGAAVCSGIGGSTMLVTSLAMTADLIGENTVSLTFIINYTYINPLLHKCSF